MTTATPAAIKADRPWEKPWPKEGLETLGKCPVCGEVDRRTLHPDLVDNAFFCAPGVWTLWQCTNCQIAYLDPRPTPETIGLAYKRYYTHGTGSSKMEYQKLCLVKKFRRQLVNGYTKKRYGAADRPANEIGFYLAWIIPYVKRVPDRCFRNIPLPRSGSNKLLDIGCGDGTFLLLARSCGWEVCGLDPDPGAVSSATAKGLTVHQAGAEYFIDDKELFDIITLSHVIEHVHDPKKTIEKCFELLKPGGILWIETPNISSRGHKEFGKNWRGLDAPRHLTIFNRLALHNFLRLTGFGVVSDVEIPGRAHWTFKASLAASLGSSSYDTVHVPMKIRAKANIANMLELLNPSRSEYLTVMARKSEKNA